MVRSVWEMLTGDACHPHRGDATVSLADRFAGEALVVIGGGGSSQGWTQRVAFAHDGAARLLGQRSAVFRRGTAAWTEHLAAEAAALRGWALLLLDQQWLAALAASSGASLKVVGIERILRVREMRQEFGGDRMAEDTVRAAVDHPTMEASIVVGARIGLLEGLEAEAISAGFQVAGIRIATFALLERYLAGLQARHESPRETIVCHDGQSALLAVVREGAFDPNEGGFSYLVSRTAAEIRTQISRRLLQHHLSLSGPLSVRLLGQPLPPEIFPPGTQLEVEPVEPLVAVVAKEVHHDLRPRLQRLRPAMPRSARAVALSAFAAILLLWTGAGALLVDIYAIATRNEEALRLDKDHALAAERARSAIEALHREQRRDRQLASWVDKNYHAQGLVHGMLQVLPANVSLDNLTVQAAEGLPQAKLRFTLIGTEEAQRVALRALEGRLYDLGYDVGKRDDPAPSSSRRGGVIHAWDLILPSFGSS